VAGDARAAFVMGSSTPTQAQALVMDANSVSGPMLINVVNGNNDAMSSWQFNLQIAPMSGATGTVTFNSPGTTDTAPAPGGYIFSNGDPIFATNAATELSANGFNLDPAGITVGNNLLSVDFQASSTASGYFGVYALQGQANTVWADPNLTTQFFTNVFDGTDRVLIGEVFVNASGGQPVATPEPSSLGLLAIGGQ
jgi:hypothetical protein